MTNPRDDLMALATNHTEVLWRKAQEARMTRNNGLAEQYADEARQWEDALRLAASRPAAQVVDREAVAWAICQSGKFETGEGTCALLCMDQLGSPRKKGCCHSARVHGKLADAILSLLRPAEPVEAALGGWTYEIQHGPDGEAAYAWVYDEEHFLVCTAKIHHAKMIVARMNDAPPKSPDIRAAVLAERERCAKIAEDSERQNEWPKAIDERTVPTQLMQRAIAAAIRQLPTTERGDK